MDTSFWLDRWQRDHIGFHQDRPTPLLLEHWPSLGLAPGATVFVPLCGKTLDMAWLASQGLRVFGVELAEKAVRAFFDDHGLTPEVEADRSGRRFRAGGIEILCGDAFALEADALQDCDAVFDRAALIALPPAMRERYAHGPYTKLPSRCRGLLVTLDYPRHEKAGPPFAVGDDEVHALYDHDWRVECIDDRDILDAQPAFVADGVTALRTRVYRIDRR